MTYARCGGCGNREIGLWPVRIGHKRFHLCGGCAEATQAALDEGTHILGPVVPEELRSSVDRLLEASRGPRTNPRGYVTPDHPLDEILGVEPLPGIAWCVDWHQCGLYGGSHKPHMPNSFCECPCHEPAF
jgi:hypothetical protein